MTAHLRAVPVVRPRAVLYLRQSVAREESVSIELQRIAGEDYCIRQGYDVAAIEIDEGYTGRRWANRPGVQRVMDMIERRDADVIILWKWSRLSRSRKDWALAADRVDVAGGRIESATEPIDTGTASGRFARGVMTEYAAFQSEQIGEQWEEVRARRFNLGLPPAGSVPWGWVSHRTHIEPHPDQAPLVAGAYQLYLSGRGFRYIASWLNRTGIPTTKGNPWLDRTVTRLLESPIHTGLVHYRGETREGAHEGIISREDWNRFWRMRKDRTIAVKPRQSKHLLSSLVVCSCGFKRYGSTARARHGDRSMLYHSYVCPSPMPHPPRMKSIATHRVDTAVGDWIKGLNVTADRTAVDHGRVDIEALAREITAVEQRLVKLTEHLVSGLVPESTYRATRDNLESERRRLVGELEVAEREQQVSPDAYLSGLEDIAERWDMLPFDEKQAVARSLIESITLTEDMEAEIKSAWGEHVVIGL